MRARLLTASVAVLASAAPGAGSQSTRGSAAVYGVAYDSLRGAPLDSAFIMVAGHAATATSDARGRFRFDSLPPGTYMFVLHHPALDSIGFTEWMVRSTVAGGDTVRVFVPSFRRLWSAACGGEKPPSDSGLVFGTIRAVGTRLPVPGARLSLSWVDVGVDKKTGITQHRVGGEVRADAAGAYTVCGIPLSTGIRILASTDSATTGVIDLPPRSLRVQRRDLTLGAASGRDSALRGVIAGRLRDAGGQPVSGARVSTQGVQEVRSGVTGEFVMRGVPVGTRQVDMTSIGSMPTSAIVDVAANDTTTLDLQLAKVTALDTMRVRATTVRQMRVQDIEDRKKLGIAHFMDSLRVEGHADFRSAVTEFPRYRCLSTLYIDGFKIDRRDIQSELRFLKPDEVGLLEWYVRGAPLQFGGGGCTLFVWTKRYFPH